MRVLVCFTDKQAVILCRPNVTRQSVVETMNLLKAGLGIHILLSLRGLGHGGILSAVKLLRVSSDKTVACDV